MPAFEDILDIVKTKATSDVVVEETTTPKAIKLHTDDLVVVCRELHENKSTYFDMLSCVTAIDNGVQAGTFELAYSLYSIPYNLHVTIKVVIPRDKPEVESINAIWKTANWHEREAFDMYGIIFKNHPDLRRILMPADWEGHPLRKDYKHQEYYRNIKVEY
jgi:NADH-quinone oxidoreductase subunit C